VVLWTQVSGAYDIDDYEVIFRANFDRLVRAMTVVSGNQEAAADAVQSAFFKAHLRWARVREYDDPLAWIRRVAINELRDEARRFGVKRRGLARLRGELETVSAAPEEPRNDWLRVLLAELPRQQRATIALYYIEELSMAEIAETLGISVGTVGFHLSRGRERLRDVLSERGEHRE
jgi:RNA polymerase sigma-70 factor, ECF subfamily